MTYTLSYTPSPKGGPGKWTITCEDMVEETDCPIHAHEIGQAILREMAEKSDSEGRCVAVCQNRIEERV